MPDNYPDVFESYGEDDNPDPIASVPAGDEMFAPPVHSIEPCDAFAPATEYFPAATQCERPKGHDGPHVAMLSNSSRRIWQDVQFKMNFKETT